MPKKDKYAHITDEALKERLVKLDAGQGWTETDPLYKRLKAEFWQLPLSAQSFVNIVWARKAQQMRLRRELTTNLKRIAKYGYRMGYDHELIDDLEMLQGKFKEWQKEVEELLNEKI